MGDYYRDVNDHLLRICKSIDGIRDMLSTAMQVNLSLIALSESEVNKKLAAYAALFAIPTMIAGVYGMNFEDIPGLKSSISFPLTLSTMVTLDILLFRYFKKSRWL
jgi:magnesium transporter